MDCVNRLTVRMIIGLVLSLFLHLSVRAEVVSNCFEIVPGYLPHIRWVDNIAVDFAIDKYGARGWEVTVHHTRGLGYVENAKRLHTMLLDAKLRSSIQIIGRNLINPTVCIVLEFGPQFLNTHKVSIQTTTTDLVSSRLREICLPETGQERSHHHHRAAQLGTAAHEIVAAYVELVDLCSREAVHPFGLTHHLHAHALKQGDKVSDIQDLRDIADGHCVRSKQGRTYHLQRFVLGTLRNNLSAQAVSSFYYE